MRVLPGGVLGGYYAPQELAFIVREARGARLIDFSGREYIDYILGSGPLVLGHAHPAVVAAVEEQLRKGTTYFQLSEPTLALAEEICRAVPCADQVRFCSTGTEATFFALRLCRAYRKKDKILKFEGGFHGTHDYSLMSVGPRAPKAFPAPTPDSAGIPHAIQDEVLIAPFNDLAEAEAMIEAHHQDLAAVIMEPFQRLIAPQPGFLEGVRAMTTRHGVPLVFDEIVTGFRFAYGGAQEYYGVVPDVVALGKVVGGGFPLSAVAGRRDIMRHLAPDLDGTPEFVAQAGTLNGNPIAAAAGLATLAELRKPGTYARLFATGTRLKDGLAAAARAAGLPAQVAGEPPVFEIFFTDRPITDYRSSLTADRELHAAFTRAMLERGVVKAAGKFYVSLAHGADDVDRTIEIFAAALERGRGSDTLTDEEDSPMAENWQNEAWAKDILVQRQDHAAPAPRPGRDGGGRPRRHDARARAVAGRLRAGQALQARHACSPCRARRRRAARRPWSASRWRSTASTSPAASTAGRSSCSSPTTSRSRTWAGARPRSSSSRTRSTPTRAATSPTSAWPACRCTRSTSSST